MVEHVEIPRRLRVSTVAQILDISPSAVYRLVRNGELGCHRMGSSIRIGPEHLQAYLDRTECRGQDQTENGSSEESQIEQSGTPIVDSTVGLSGFRSERRMSAALDKRSRTLSAGLRIIEDGS